MILGFALKRPVELVSLFKDDLLPLHTVHPFNSDQKLTHMVNEYVEFESNLKLGQCIGPGISLDNIILYTTTVTAALQH